MLITASIYRHLRQKRCQDESLFSYECIQIDVSSSVIRRDLNAYHLNYLIQEKNQGGEMDLRLQGCKEALRVAPRNKRAQLKYICQD